MKKLIKITGLLLVGLLTSSSALAYYVSGGSVYYGSSGNPGSSAGGTYTYDNASGTAEEGYLGNVNTGLPSTGDNINTGRLVTSSTSSVENWDVYLPSSGTTVHWFQFTASVASILTATYEWNPGFWEDGSADTVFTISLYQNNDESDAVYGPYSYSFTGQEIRDFATSGHYDGFFADIPTGDWLIKITGAGTSDFFMENAYTVTFEAAAVPLPPAALLFISALAGFGVIGRKKASS